jgi:putative ribosome biogenesis GTPase RsgA
MYATVQDIQDDWKKIDFTSSGAIVTTAKVENIITEESNYINGWINNKYIIPVSSIDSPISHNILKRICIFRTSERIKNILEVKTGNTQTDSDEKQNKNFARTPNSDLRDIQSGKIQLPDALRSADGMGSFNIETGQCFEFDVSKQQW